MHGGFYTHYSLGDTFERMAPSLVFGLLLVCRMVIWYQVSARERKEEAFMRKLYEETSSLNKQELSDEAVEYEDHDALSRKRNSIGTGGLVTNKKNVAKHGDKEEKKIK